MYPDDTNVTYSTRVKKKTFLYPEDKMYVCWDKASKKISLFPDELDNIKQKVLRRTTKLLLRILVSMKVTITPLTPRVKT